MATVDFQTFPTDSEGIELQSKVRKALTHLCGHGLSKENVILTAPPKLNAERDQLRENYRDIWRVVVIEYDENEAGASAWYKTKKIRLGPLFLRPFFKVMDVEKVLLHEFLHLALDVSDEKFHHGFIEQIIKYNIGYPGDANPVCSS